MIETTDSIFIAGHRGMVGSAIHRLLLREGFTNIVTAAKSDVDLRNQQQTEDFFAHTRPAYVFLAAAKVGGIHANNTYKAEFIYDNIMIAANVIRAAHASGVNKLVNLGSSCIYPKFAAQPINEDALLTGALEATNEPYAIAKIAAIKLCSSFNAQYGTDYLSLMPTNLYGENDNYNLETSHVLPALVRKMRLAKLLRESRFDDIRRDLQSRPLGFGTGTATDESNDGLSAILSRFGITPDSLTLWGTGTVFREFLHADDVAAAALHFMRRVSAREAGEVVNIGTGTDVSIAELAAMIARSTGYDGTLLFDASKPDGTPKKLLDVRKAAALGWTASIPLEAGLHRVVQAYRNG
ncbi:MAG: GDP-L-fucose synthase [Candidatus Kapabacteria bacterium]|nr:GDP-L-fucose synthase [Candidatus Kapabacteria bacterium]